MSPRSREPAHPRRRWPEWRAALGWVLDSWRRPAGSEGGWQQNQTRAAGRPASDPVPARSSPVPARSAPDALPRPATHNARESAMSHPGSVRPADQRTPRTADEARQRKERILTKERASITHSIAEAIVIKDEDLFFLSYPDGRVPLEGAHGCGLYYHDCRYLDGYEMKLAQAELDVLAVSAAAGDGAVHELTNPDIRLQDGRLLQKEELGIKIERRIDGRHLALADVLTIRNFAHDAVELPLTLTFRTEFDDIFEVRGLLAERMGHKEPPAWRDGVLHFVYDGADKVRRELRITCSPAPKSTSNTSGEFLVRVEPRATWRLDIAIEVAEAEAAAQGRSGTDRSGTHRSDTVRPGTELSGSGTHDGGAATAATAATSATGPASPTAATAPTATTATPRRAESPQERDRRARRTRVESGSPLLNGVIERSFRDLRMLRSRLRDRQFFAAGVPWFVTLFGRDSLIASLETLAYDATMAEETLRLLATYQSDAVDEWRDAEPGKIPHELRFGEMAHLGEIPHSPYYGTVDATPLFLVALGHHADWTGDLRLFHDLRDNVERALAWIDRYGAPDGDGYVAYRSTSKKGLVNQGWKDSGNAIVNTDGSLAEPPIALVEVQAYVYQAKAAAASLFRRAGDDARADRLEREAADLRDRFNRDFWLEDADFFALARQKGGRPVAAVSSNPGQALWCGIVERSKATKTAARLMRDDMFSGWGVRTLSADEKGYNPIGYHLGTVWPHDNALIAVGMRRHGFDDAFHRIFAGILAAASHFHNDRLPEVFAGFDRAEYGVPVKYPVACHPQAWAAGSVPYMLTAMLGLVPHAFDRRLEVVRPTLPPFVSHVDVSGLRVGDARVDLRFEQAEHGRARAEVLKVDGDLDVGIHED